MSVAFVAVSPHPASSGADLYVQVPGGGDHWAGGAGVLAAPAHLVPYLQVGRVNQDGSGWFTTQGYVWMDEFEPGLQLDPPYTRVRPRFWAPSLAYRGRVADLRMQFTLTGAFGSYRYTRIDDREPTFVERRRVSTVMLGVSMETDIRNAFRW
jgi:hypothetical protein